MSLRIDNMKASDWPTTRAIYASGIATGLATFETEAPAWEAWHRAHRRDCRLVARHQGALVGWAALSPVSSRAVYAGVAEVSVYVAGEHWGQGIGSALLQALITASEAAGVWTLQAAIFPENRASIALHRKCGFRQMGHRERIAQLHGQWRNTVLLERRSCRVGAGDK